MTDENYIAQYPRTSYELTALVQSSTERYVEMIFVIRWQALRKVRFLYEQINE